MADTNRTVNTGMVALTSTESKIPVEPIIPPGSNIDQKYDYQELIHVLLNDRRMRDIQATIIPPVIPEGSPLVLTSTSWEFSRAPKFTFDSEEERSKYIIEAFYPLLEKENLDRELFEQTITQDEYDIKLSELNKKCQETLLSYSFRYPLRDDESIYCRTKNNFNNGKSSNWSMIIDLHGDQRGITLSDVMVNTPWANIYIDYDRSSNGQIVVEGSPFKMFVGPGVHANSDWEIADSDGIVVFKRHYDVDNLTSIRLDYDIVKPTKSYEIRFRYRSDTGAVSNWFRSMHVNYYNSNVLYDVELIYGVVIGKKVYFKVTLFTNMFESVDIEFRNRNDKVIKGIYGSTDLYPVTDTEGLVVGERYYIYARINNKDGSTTEYKLIKIVEVKENDIYNYNKDIKYNGNYSFNQDIILYGNTIQSTNQRYTETVLLVKHGSPDVHRYKIVNNKLIDNGIGFSLEDDVTLPYVNILNLDNDNVIVNYSVEDNTKMYKKSVWKEYQFDFITKSYTEVRKLERPNEWWSTAISASACIDRNNNIYYIPARETKTINEKKGIYEDQDLCLYKLDYETFEISKVSELPFKVTRHVTLSWTHDNRIVILGGSVDKHFDDEIPDDNGRWKLDNNEIWVYNPTPPLPPEPDDNIYDSEGNVIPGISRTAIVCSNCHTHVEFTDITCPVCAQDLRQPDAVEEEPVDPDMTLIENQLPGTWELIGYIPLDYPTYNYCLQAYLRRDDHVVVFNATKDGPAINSARTLLIDYKNVDLEEATNITYENNEINDMLPFRSCVVLNNGDFLRISSTDSFYYKENPRPQKVFRYVGSSMAAEDIFDDEDAAKVQHNLVVQSGQYITIEDPTMYDTIVINGTSMEDTGRLRWLRKCGPFEFNYKDLIFTRSITYPVTQYNILAFQGYNFNIIGNAIFTVEDDDEPEFVKPPIIDIPDDITIGEALKDLLDKIVENGYSFVTENGLFITITPIDDEIDPDKPDPVDPDGPDIPGVTDPDPDKPTKPDPDGPDKPGTGGDGEDGDDKDPELPDLPIVKPYEKPEIIDMKLSVTEYPLYKILPDIYLTYNISNTENIKTKSIDLYVDGGLYLTNIPSSSDIVGGKGINITPFFAEEYQRTEPTPIVVELKLRDTQDDEITKRVEIRFVKWVWYGRSIIEDISKVADPYNAVVNGDFEIRYTDGIAGSYAFKEGRGTYIYFIIPVEYDPELYNFILSDSSITVPIKLMGEVEFNFNPNGEDNIDFTSRYRYNVYRSNNMLGGASTIEIIYNDNKE